MTNMESTAIHPPLDTFYTRDRQFLKGIGTVDLENNSITRGLFVILGARPCRRGQFGILDNGLVWLPVDRWNRPSYGSRSVSDSTRVAPSGSTSSNVRRYL